MASGLQSNKYGDVGRLNEAAVSVDMSSLSKGVPNGNLIGDIFILRIYRYAVKVSNPASYQMRIHNGARRVERIGLRKLR